MRDICYGSADLLCEKRPIGITADDYLTTMHRLGSCAGQERKSEWSRAIISTCSGIRTTECWIADVPDLRLCSAHGDSPRQALAELEIAMELWLETARAIGQPVPEPRYSPAIYAGR